MWVVFIKSAVALLLGELVLALGILTFMIMRGAGDAADNARLQAVGTELVLPALTATLGILVALAGVKVVSTVWYNLRRRSDDPRLAIAPFDW
jgi:uncharacterized membrane protein